MAEGIGLFVYPAKDVSLAKSVYSKLLGVEPYADKPYHVGFRSGEQEIGLDPNGRSNGPIAYRHTDDIEGKLRELLDAGAQAREGVRDVGGGRLIALVTDPDGNVIGLTQNP